MESRIGSLEPDHRRKGARVGWLVAGFYSALITLSFLFGGAGLALSILLAVAALFLGLRPDLASRAITDWARHMLPRARAGSSS